MFWYKSSRILVHCFIYIRLELSKFYLFAGMHEIEFGCWRTSIWQSFNLIRYACTYNMYTCTNNKDHCHTWEPNSWMNSNTTPIRISKSNPKQFLLNQRDYFWMNCKEINQILYHPEPSSFWCHHLIAYRPSHINFNNI